MNQMTFRQLLESRLSDLASSGRKKTLPGSGTHHLSSNDYLGLSRHPAVIEAICSATKEYGAGATGSRLLSGNHPLNALLEEAIADFKGGPSALVFSTGYQANLAAIRALSTLYPTIYSDRHIHASLIDGIRLSGNRCEIYPHNDLITLKEMIENRPVGEPFLIITEALFSMDGDRGPLAALLGFCDEYDGMLLIDDAHGTGTLGPGGRGGLEAAALAFNPQRMVLSGTFSKALGVLGGFVVCHPLIRELLVSVGRSFIYTTALPPGVLAGNLAALTILDQDETLVPALQKTARTLREALNLPLSGSPVIPLRGPLENLQAIQEEFRLNGLITSVIGPPTVAPGEERIRLSVCLPWEEDLTRTITGIVRKHLPTDSSHSPR